MPHTKGLYSLPNDKHGFICLLELVHIFPQWHRTIVLSVHPYFLFFFFAILGEFMCV